MDDIIQKILVTGEAVSAISMYRDLTNATNQYNDIIRRMEASAKATNTTVSAASQWGAGIGERPRGHLREIDSLETYIAQYTIGSALC